MIDTGWKGKVQFYELAFGTWIACLFLVFIWKKLFIVEHDGWRYTRITLIGGSFYIVNHYFLRAPFYDVLINSDTSIFLLLYYFILAKPFTLPLIKKAAFPLSSILFTLIYSRAENLARFLKEGKLIPELLKQTASVAARI
jgi:hypothetical protein